MKKAPEAFRTISEVAELLETPAHVLRFWESKFYQIRPVKRAGGRRYYRPDDVALINGIRILLQDRGLTIRGVQRLLQEKGLRHVVDLGSDLPEGPPAALDAEAPDDLPDAPDSEAEIAPTLAAPPPAPPPPPPPRAPLGTLPPAPPRPPRPEPAPAAAAAPQPAAAAATPARPSPAPAPEPLPEPEPEEEPAGPRLSRQLRTLGRDLPPAQRERMASLARRLDRLLDRMSEASGVGRW